MSTFTKLIQAPAVTNLAHNIMVAMFAYLFAKVPVLGASGLNPDAIVTAIGTIVGVVANNNVLFAPAANASTPAHLNGSVA